MSLFRRNRRSPSGDVKGTVYTDAGGMALWDAGAFGTVIDYDSWDAQLGEEAHEIEHVIAGNIVPLIHGLDAAFGVLARVGSDGPTALTPREQAQLVASSEGAYLLVSSGRCYLSGIEHIHSEADQPAISVPVPPGRWQATIHILDWQGEPRMQLPDGSPHSDALPDIVVLISPETDPVPQYRQDLVAIPPFD